MTMRVAVGQELVPAILAFNPEDPANIPLAAEAKVCGARGPLWHHDRRYYVQS